MIVPMRKVYVVSRRDDRQALLDALAGLGILHVEPVNPARAVALEEQIHAIQTLELAQRLLAPQTPAGPKPDLDPMAAAEEVQKIERDSLECQTRLSALQRQMAELEPWGDVRLEQFKALREAGIDIRFYEVPIDATGAVDGEFVQVVAEPFHANTALVAVVTRGGEEPSVPEAAERLPLPERDRPTIRAEARKVDEQLKADADRLRQLAHLRGAIDAELARRREQAQYTIASRSGLEEEHLYAIQGWAPAEKADGLEQALADAGVPAAVMQTAPTDEEIPPTLVRYPTWARPIKALFKILGTTPAYREYDLAPFFMLAMPIFTAMLVGDAMYGVIFTIVGLLAYGKLAKLAGKSAPQLVLAFGIATILWGVITGNYFGVAPRHMIDAGGFWAGLGHVLHPLAVLWRENEAEARGVVIQISFLLAVIHLVTAHLRQLIGLFPHPRALAEGGWCLFLIGMFGVVWSMFKLQPAIPTPLILALLAAGAVLIVLFTVNTRNPFKRVGLGILSNLMPMINTFGDTISYIRLMAVGLASYYIAAAFNGLGMTIASGGVAFWVPAAIMLILAHALNIILCLIAIFAHGVRLNMLEFSSNAGVQWAGYPYAPFAAGLSNEGER